MTNCASLTAEYMALFRAFESLRPARQRLFSDPYAPLFLSGWRRSVHRAARVGPAFWVLERLFDRNLPGARAAAIARTKWIDDGVTRALATCGQLVLLGAGFDTRALRLPAARRVRVFELDHPETSEAKQAELRKNAGLPPNVRFLTIDFNKQTPLEVLHQAGFDGVEPACFVWEGVTNYLSPEAVDASMRQFGQAAFGSALLFTYVHRGVLDDPQQFFGACKLLSRLRDIGEPWTFGFCPGETAPYLARRNLRLVEDIGVAEAWSREGRPPAEMRGYEFYRLASATVSA
jgi:methyltransferase (TIGR00027 family)